MTRFRDMSDDQLRHERATIDQALLARADLRRRQGGEPMLPDESAGEGGGTVRALGMSYTWRGTLGLVSLILVLGLTSIASVGYVVHQGFVKLDAREVERLKSIQDAAAARAHQTVQMSTEHTAILEGIRALVYVATLPEAERTRIKLSRPQLILEMEARR
jgi:hypothetical protein